MSIWIKISEEYFQHLAESMPQIIKAVLKEKGVQPGTSNVLDKVYNTLADYIKYEVRARCQNVFLCYKCILLGHVVSKVFIHFKVKTDF